MISTQQPPSAEFSLVGCLAHHPFFDSLARDELTQIAARAVPRAFAAGEMLYLEGEPSAGLWMIERGGIKVYKLNPEGAELILHLLGPGETFNEISAVDGGPNPAHAAAMSDATCWLLPSEVVIEALKLYPGLALAVIGKLAARVRLLVGRMEDLTLYPAAARLARFLLQQADAPARASAGVTRAAIAAHLATTPETVSRLLRSFEEAGAIRFDRHHIVILNPAVLRAIALL